MSNQTWQEDRRCRLSVFLYLAYLQEIEMKERLPFLAQREALEHQRATMRDKRPFMLWEVDRGMRSLKSYDFLRLWW